MNNYSHKLHIKVAVSIGFGAVLAAFILSFFSYFNALESEKIKDYLIIEQLVNTVEKTASIAAYIEDEELAQEIVDGLTGNVLISAVKLSNEQGVNVVQGTFAKGSQDVILALLNHPFVENLAIGKLSIYPNNRFIHSQAQTEAKKQIIILIIYSVVIALFVSALVHRFFTMPLQRLTLAFSKVDPSKPHATEMPEYAHADEIGTMTNGINTLMEELHVYIANEKMLREKTEALEHKFRLIFERASAGICLINGNNELVTTNQAFNAMLLRGEMPDNNDLPALFENPYDVAHYLHQIRTNKLINNFSVDLKRKFDKNGRAGWIACLFSMVKDEREPDRAQDSILIEVIMYDVTERAEREVRTRFEADHDALTHLKNRRSGERQLAELLYEALHCDHHMILMMIDLDKFKPVNDKFGHDAGDMVLIEVGKRLMSFFHQEKDLCVRWGGDEFVAARVVTQYDSVNVEKMAQKLLGEIKAPIALQSGAYCHIGASVGIVIAPLHGDTLPRLLSRADNTMYRVKKMGRDRCVIYNKNLDA